MKTLYMFCVVLYFQRGGCLYPPINGNYQNQKSEQYNDQRNPGTISNSPYNFHNNPSEINYQNEPQQLIEQQSLPMRTINEPYLRQRESIGFGVQHNSPPQTRTELREINKTPSRESDVLNKQVVPSEYLGIPSIRNLNKEIFHETNTKQIVPASTGKVNKPSLKLNEEIILELQGASPEYIQTLIGKQGPRVNKQNPSLINHSYQNIHGNLNYPKQPSQPLQHQYPAASFQNPSAESLYKLKQALPYRINTQNFLNTPKEDDYVKNIIKNSRRIQEIYKSERPVKRYTIIHPDGTIEEIDQIEGLFEKNPNYILVKSDDIMKHIQGRPIAFSKPQTPIEQNPAVKTITINKQPNVEQNRGNSIPDLKTSMTLPVVTNSILIKDRKLPTLTETHFKGTAINKTSNATESDPITLSQTETSPSTHHGIISKPSSVPAVTETIEKSVGLFSVNTTEIIKTAVENSQQNQVRNETELKTSGIENHNVIGSNVLLSSSTTAVGPDNSSKNFSDFLINTTPTPILNESITLTSVQDSMINSSDSSDLEMNKESLDLVIEPPSTAPPNNTGNSSIWFKVDDNFWNKLISGNNSQNLIYFLFVPPKTNPEKETKTTIYPNGTTVEEVIERITGNDGEPKITRSTTITHKNNTEVYS